MGDAAIAIALAALGASLAAGTVDGSDTWLAVTLAVAHSLPLVWRRRRPELVLAAMGVSAAGAVAAGFPSVVLGPAVLAGAHGLGATRRRDRALPVLALTVLVMVVVVRESDADASTVVGNAVALVVAWWLGDRQQRAHARAGEAVAAERLRIARELHDVVAHALSVIAVQAGTGRVLVETDPATAEAALRAIEGESRTALDEMRRLLAVLRDDETEAGPLAPSPGLDDLDHLAAVTAGAGLPVEVHVEGDPRPVPAGVGLAAYRIVQEALTNARRHAGATRAEVRVAWPPGAVEVEVLDDGRGAASTGATAGHGLAGMRERAALYGGTLEAGSRDGGGFRVATRIPVGGQR